MHSDDLSTNHQTMSIKPAIRSSPSTPYDSVKHPSNTHIVDIHPATSSFVFNLAERSKYSSFQAYQKRISANQKKNTFLKNPPPSFTSMTSNNNDGQEILADSQSHCQDKLATWPAHIANPDQYSTTTSRSSNLRMTYSFPRLGGLEGRARAASYVSEASTFMPCQYSMATWPLQVVNCEFCRTCPPRGSSISCFVEHFPDVPRNVSRVQSSSLDAEVHSSCSAELQFAPCPAHMSYESSLSMTTPRNEATTPINTFPSLRRATRCITRPSLTSEGWVDLGVVDPSTPRWVTKISSVARDEKWSPIASPKQKLSVRFKNSILKKFQKKTKPQLLQNKSGRRVTEAGAGWGVRSMRTISGREAPTPRTMYFNSLRMPESTPSLPPLPSQWLKGTISKGRSLPSQWLQPAPKGKGPGRKSS
ncbi:hypothetical protein O181_020059 [Austropuccinia psidii MF-1]|uniref:Uncharacterized protein n=1 Tax=Austropuccinia psidii MF-1 TaxID=1389203 RepID=A0A9Q3C880_9BASI|nr:hypothetical protein [Austropuccinia psidii MF-1]